MIASTDAQNLQTAATDNTASPAEKTKRSLADLAKRIRQDASREPLAYLLRSNTSHDGE
jgi:hypothetical protein